MLIERVIYQAYRYCKLFFLTREPSWISRSFFRVISFIDSFLSHSASSVDHLSESAWRLRYIARYPTSPLYILQTNFPVAINSHDHQMPRGSAFDNSINKRFNYRLMQYFGRGDNIRVLDLGCSGGGFVRSLLEDGLEAVGIEGSDVGLRTQSREWPHIPLHLFVADISKPFTLADTQSQKILFHCITAWEVLEHISENDIYVCLKNIQQHLSKDGIFVASVDMTPDGNHDTGAIYHLSLFSRDYWLNIFRTAGFEEISSHNFEIQDFVRGHGRGLKDWSPLDGDGFHVVLRHGSDQDKAALI